MNEGNCEWAKEKEEEPLNGERVGRRRRRRFESLVGDEPTESCIYSSFIYLIFLYIYWQNNSATTWYLSFFNSQDNFSAEHSATNFFHFF
jgi:hypothetical protein